MMQFINASSRLFEGKDKNVIPEEGHFKIKLNFKNKKHQYF